MKRWIALMPLAGLLGLGVVFAGFGLKHNPHYTPDALVGRPLPDVSLPALDGGPAQSLRQAAGPETLVNFYGSWCVPCAQEAPTLMALKAQGVRIIGVAVAWNYDPAKTRAFLTQHGDPYAADLVDRDGHAALDFGVSGVPETYLVGPDHVILAKVAEPLTPDSAERLLERGNEPR